MDIVINNIKINYIKKEIGSKTNIIFLHGWGANINSFMPVINEVSKKYNVYAIDLPGFGLSDEPPANYMVNLCTIFHLDIWLIIYYNEARDEGTIEGAAR